MKRGKEESKERGRCVLEGSSRVSVGAEARVLGAWRRK